MTNTFGLEIFAADKLFYHGRAKEIIFTAVDGEMGFMAHHADIIAAIEPGTLKFQTEDGQWTEAAVSYGFIEMINNRAKVFALTVERPEDIDILRAREAKERAEEQLRQKLSIQQYHINQMALRRAMTRLRVSKDNHINL